MSAPFPADAWALSPPMHDHRVVPLPSRAKPAARLVPVNTIALERTSWLWEGHIPSGMLSLLAGRPGCGKSTLAVALAAIVTRAGNWPDGIRCKKAGDALYWTSEDAPGTIRARAEASGADLARFHLIDGDAGGNPFDPARHVPQLSAALDFLPDARAIILDPIVNAISGDVHKTSDVRRDLAPLLDLASRRGIALIGVTHFRKGSEDSDPLERLIGSQAFGALARMVWIASKDASRAGSDHDRLIALAKSNVSADGIAWRYGLARKELGDGIEGQCVNWGAQERGDAHDILRKAEARPQDDASADTGSPEDELVEILRAALASGPRPPGEVQKEAVAAGFRMHQIERAKTRAKIRSVKRGMRGGWFWALPEDRRSPEGPQSSQSSAIFGGDLQSSGFPPFPSAEDCR